MFPPLKMAELEIYQNVIITSEDTDVFVLAAASVLNIKIY